MPLLESLHIEATDDIAEQLAPVANQPLSLDSPLRHVRILGLGLRTCAYHSSSVTSLHIHQVHSDMQVYYYELRQVFQCLQALTCLIISGGDIVQQWPSAAQARAINLPALRCLHIGTHPNQFGQDVSGFLVAISAPLLQSLLLQMLPTKSLRSSLRLYMGLYMHPNIHHYVLSPLIKLKIPTLHYRILPASSPPSRI